LADSALPAGTGLTHVYIIAIVVVVVVVVVVVWED
jgi:hypothetical protein